MNSSQAQPIAPDNQPAVSSEVVIETFSVHHHLEWYYNHQIAVAPSLGKPKRDLVDDWCAMARTVFDRWPDGKPVLLLVDFRLEVSPTPYQSAKAYELINYKRERCAYIAIVSSNNFSGQITRLALRTKNRHNGRIQQFPSLPEALDWLVKIGNVQVQTI